jgi:hypothetical protein
VIAHIVVDDGERLDLALVRVVKPLPASPDARAVELLVERVDRVLGGDGDGAQRCGSPSRGFSRAV